LTLTNNRKRQIKAYIESTHHLCQNGIEVRRCIRKDIGERSYVYIVAKNLSIWHTELTVNIVHVPVAVKVHIIEGNLIALTEFGVMTKAYSMQQWNYIGAVKKAV